MARKAHLMNMQTERLVGSEPVQLVRGFETLTRADIAIVGGKNASLGEMINALAPRGIRVPGGFATTATAYWHFLDANGL